MSRGLKWSLWLRFLFLLSVCPSVLSVWRKHHVFYFNSTITMYVNFFFNFKCQDPFQSKGGGVRTEEKNHEIFLIEDSYVSVSPQTIIGKPKKYRVHISSYTVYIQFCSNHVPQVLRCKTNTIFNYKSIGTLRKGMMSKLWFGNSC